MMDMQKCSLIGGHHARAEASGEQADDQSPASDLGYSLQSNRKALEGSTHPDRDAQFQYINCRAKAFQQQGQPRLSVDTKKKELVGQFHNCGCEWYTQGQPEEG
jgi:hypothetical protein